MKWIVVFVCMVVLGCLGCEGDKQHEDPEFYSCQIGHCDAAWVSNETCDWEESDAGVETQELIDWIQSEYCPELTYEFTTVYQWGTPHCAMCVISK